MNLLIVIICSVILALFLVCLPYLLANNRKSSNISWSSDYYSEDSDDFSFSIAEFDDGSIHLCVLNADDEADFTGEFSNIESAKKYISYLMHHKKIACDSDFDFMLDEPK